MNLLKLLNQPYPLTCGDREILRSGLFFGSLVFLVLFLFRPFTLSSLTHFSALNVSFYYGSITFSMVFINFYFFVKTTPWLNEKTWTLKKDLIWSGYMFAIISFANYTFTWFYFQLESPFISGYGLFNSLYITIVVGFIPYSAATLLRQNKLYKENYKKALELNSQINLTEVYQNPADTFGISIESGRDVLNIDSESILAIEAIENYINIFYFNENSVVKKMMRASLTQIENQLSGSNYFYRCHRSYIVNLNRVNNIEGNSQGYRLKLEGMEDEIPVSRNKIADFNNRIKMVKMVA